MTTPAILLARKLAGLCRCGASIDNTRSRCSRCYPIYLRSQRARRRRLRSAAGCRVYRCSECFREGHNIQACPDLESRRGT